ncbi:hypothetical protein Tco_1416960 [Tanacetum coccineum]
MTVWFFNEDMVTLLKCVPLFKEIQVYLESVVLLVEKDLVKVRSQCKCVVIKKIVEENVVNNTSQQKPSNMLLEYDCSMAVEKEANVLLLEWHSLNEVEKEANVVKSSR